MLPSASLRLGRIRSIEINVNITWLIVFGLLIYWLRTGFIAEAAPEASSVVAWAVSIVGALVLFASVLAHELAHSLVALRNGLPIKRITLFIFGGVAHMEREPASPGVEFKMAVAGPLASIGIALVAGTVRFGLLRHAAGSAPALVFEYATYANAGLAVFNLIPGYPLDGGRLLRAILWKTSGNYVRSTVIASALGRAVGLGLVFLGAMLSVAWDSLSLLWLVLVGSFLERLAFFGAFRARMQGRGLTVGDVMRSDFVVISPAVALEAAQQIFTGGSQAHPVAQGAEVVGVISKANLAQVPQTEWPTTTVGSVMSRCGQGCTAYPEESARTVLRRMLDLGIGSMPVLKGARLVGIVNRGDLVAAVTAIPTDR